jgi:hypothetical protein
MLNNFGEIEKLHLSDVFSNKQPAWEFWLAAGTIITVEAP